MPVRVEVYQHLLEAEKNHVPCVLATVINTANSTAANVGDKALIHCEFEQDKWATTELIGWIGGGCCKGVVKKLAPKILQTNTAMIIRVCPQKEFISEMDCYPSHCPSEGTVDIFLEPVANEAGILLYGQTPVAQSIAYYSDELGQKVSWYQAPETFSETDKVLASVAIIATQGQGDSVALKAALASDATHILLVASQKKADALIGGLQNDGVCEKTLERIVSPAGIPIGAKKPAEIALSVMAQVIQLTHAKQASTTHSQISPRQSKPAETQDVELKAVPSAMSSVPSSCCAVRSNISYSNASYSNSHPDKE